MNFKLFDHLSTEWIHMSPRTDTQVSTGAGIAIFGVWIGGAGLTTMIMLIMFVWSPQKIDISTKSLEGGSALILILLIAAPMIAAFGTTKMILNKDD
jgi:hypothetical protein